MALRTALFGLALAPFAAAMGGVAAAAPSTTPDPILPGTATNCVEYHDVVAGDGCYAIIQEYPPLTSAQFYSYNPYLHTNCDNLLLGFRVCVEISGGTPSFSTTSAKPTSTTTGPPPSSTDPKLPGSACNCAEWHDVVSGDGCYSIVQEYPPLTSDEFFTYNPYLHTNCDNLLLGFAVCVQITGPQPSFCSTTSTPTTAPPTTAPPTINTTPYSPIGATTTSVYTPRNTTASATGFPPSPTQPGITSNCTKFYQVGIYDTCQSIASLYQSWIDLDDFLQMNPSLGSNCTGLLAGYYVCVGMPMNVSSSNTTVPQSFPAWTPPIGSTATPDITPSPVQSGIITNCVGFYQAQSSDNCAEIASMYYIPPADLEQWNPALGTNCSGLMVGDYYCVANSTATSAQVPTVTTTPSPTQSGIVADCQAWYQATPGDDCEVVTWEFGTFNETDFIDWNPAVGQNCTGLVIGDWYCVSVPGTPTTPTSSMSFAPTSTGTPNPVQLGIIQSCTSYWLVSVDDTCATLSERNDITQAQLTAWNPALKSDCSGLQQGYYVCVGTGTPTTGAASTGAASTGATSTGAASTGATSSTTQAIQAPAPNRTAKLTPGSVGATPA